LWTAGVGADWFACFAVRCPGLISRLDGDAGPVPAPLMQQLAALEARLGAQ
jgi:hypothetical protein